MKRGWLGLSAAVAVICSNGVAGGAEFGFEIGNGSRIDPNVHASTLLRDLEECPITTDGEITKLKAPEWDRSIPRTSLTVKGYSMATSAEEAIRAFLGAKKGWVAFKSGKWAGIYREENFLERGTRRELSQLEMHLFDTYKKFVILLRGTRESKTYLSLEKSLLSDID